VTPLINPWWARLRQQPEPGSPAPETLVAVLSEEFPAGAVVDLPDEQRPAAWQVAVRTDADGRVRSVETRLPDAAPLWYVELPEPTAEPPATTLLAFADDRYAEGTLLPSDEARVAGIAGTGQVAAVRWWTDAGLVHQLFVAPTHRRRGIGGKLVQVAFGVQAARGLPALPGDGRRTRLGEQFRAGLPAYAAGRLSPWSLELPPMDV
jgi:GNAT superfamily N-acetyltransferase